MFVSKFVSSVHTIFNCSNRSTPFGQPIFRIKSDSCASQYKCKWVFKQWQSIAVSKERTVMMYFVRAGHVKGLVDAMSGFGVKGPLWKAVVTESKLQ